MTTAENKVEGEKMARSTQKSVPLEFICSVCVQRLIILILIVGFLSSCFTRLTLSVVIAQPSFACEGISHMKSVLKRLCLCLIYRKSWSLRTTAKKLRQIYVPRTFYTLCALVLYRVRIETKREGRERERRKYKNWRNTMEKEMRRAHLKSQTLKSFSLRNLRELSFCYTINTKRAYGRSKGSADSWVWPLLPLLPKWSGINQKTVWRFRLHHLFKCIKLHRVGVGKSTMYRHV